MSTPRPLPGTRLVAALLACGLLWCAGRAVTGVRLDGPPRSAGPPAVWRVDLNAAPAAELELLPGIGPRLAERIVADREAHGPYETLAALARVPGVGPRTVEAIGPHAVAGPGRSNPPPGNAD